MPPAVIRLSDDESDSEVEILDSRPVSRPILIPSSDNEEQAPQPPNAANMTTDSIITEENPFSDFSPRRRRLFVARRRLSNEQPPQGMNQALALPQSQTQAQPLHQEDEVEIIGEQEIPGGNQFTTRPLPENDFFHLHLPTGRMLLSRLMFGDGTPLPQMPQRVPRTRIVPRRSRYHTITAAQQRQATLRQQRLRRQQEEANARARQAVDRGDSLFIPSDSDHDINEIQYVDDDDGGEHVSIIGEGEGDGDGDGDGDELIEDDVHVVHANTPSIAAFVPHREEGISPAFMYRQLLGLTERFSETGSSADNGIPLSVMQEIQRREEQLEDKRFKKRMAVMDKQRRVLEKKNAIPLDDRDKYTDVLGSQTEKAGCELCGVELFKGIPTDLKNDDHHNNSNNDIDDGLKKLSYNGFKSPWYAHVDQLSQLDKDLSKNAYFSKCGHIYCGRCVKNIDTYISKSAGEKRALIQKDKKAVNGSIHTSLDEIQVLKIRSKLIKNFSPTKCVGAHCSTNFNKKKPFSQLFF